jgi:cytochrome c
LAVFASIALASAAMAEGNPGPGAKLFNRCKGCHAVGPGAANRVGPMLNGVVGRTPGTVSGYAYSDAMAAFGPGHVWDEATLAAYLTNPRALVAGTKMSFAGLSDPKQVADLIAYLKAFGVDGSTVTASSEGQAPK